MYNSGQKNNSYLRTILINRVPSILICALFLSIGSLVRRAHNQLNWICLNALTWQKRGAKLWWKSKMFILEFPLNKSSTKILW